MAPTDAGAWLHKFINCVPFGADAPAQDIARAHEILNAALACVDLLRAHHGRIYLHDECAECRALAAWNALTPRDV